MHPPRLPLLLSHCHLNTLPPPLHGASSKRFVTVVRSYLPKRKIFRPIYNSIVRRVIARQEEYTVGGNTLELDFITPLHQRQLPGPPIRRRPYMPPTARDTRPRLSLGSTPPIRKVALGPPIREIFPRPDTEQTQPVRRATLDPLIREVFLNPEQRPTAHGGNSLIRWVGMVPDDPFPELRPFRTEDPPAEMTAPGHQMYLDAGDVEKRRVLKNLLSLEGHIIDRPDVKTTYVDTHCHLFTTLQMLKDTLQDSTIPKDDIATFVKTIFPKQAVACVDIHCDLPLNDYHEKATTLDWPDHFKYYFAIGAHPHTAMNYTDEVHARLTETMSHPSCVAWGECGLDYHKNPPNTHSTQRAVFQRQLRAAVALKKPLIIHTRSADDDTLSCIRDCVPRDHYMHLHCFTSGKQLAKAVLEEYPNAYIGVTGVVSHVSSEHVSQMVMTGELPVERMLLETDSPYMVPKAAYTWLAEERPLERRKRFVVSHAGMIPFTAERLVEMVNMGRRERGGREVGLEEVLEITRRNAGKMYGIDV